MKLKKKILALFLFLGLGAAAFIFSLPSGSTEVVEGVTVPDLYLNSFLPWRLGLDLIGGSALVYDIDLSGVEREDWKVVTSNLKDVIEKRVNPRGVSENRVRVVEKGDKRQLLVELAGVKDIEEAIKQIGDTPVLDFRENCSEIEGGIICQKTELTGRFIKKATFGSTGQGISAPIVNLEFDEEGAKIFEDVTGRNVGKPLAIFLDNELIDAPLVNEKIIGGSAQISGGDMTMESAKKLVDRFNFGALSAPVSLVNQRTVNSTAAADSLTKILIAGAIGIIAIMLFMVICYRTLGLISSLSLMLYIVFALAIFKLTPGFTMSLAGMTGFILSIGSAVDANILIFERSKEEMKKGASKLAAIESGFKFAWSSIRDSNVSTIIVSLILYFFTTSFVQGFALTLAIGILVNLVTTYLVTRNILKVLIRNKVNS